MRVSQMVQRPSWLAAARHAPLGLHAQLIPASLYPLSVPNATYPIERQTQHYSTYMMQLIRNLGTCFIWGTTGSSDTHTQPALLRREGDSAPA